MPESTETCSRCGKERDTQGAPPWCKACRAKYQRDYQALRKEMSESRGFAAGISAMRAYLADTWDKYPDIQTFTGPQIARVIRNVRGPDMPAESA